MTKCILIDPPYKSYYDNKLFDEKDNKLNRDHVLRPFINIKKYFSKYNIAVHTVDKFFKNDLCYKNYYYFSFGIRDNYKYLKNFTNVNLSGFIVLEPPLIGQKIYKSLEQISNFFSKVFLLNTIGDGYNKNLVNKNKLELFYHPHSFLKVHDEYWKNNNRKEMVIINGNKSSISSKELYSKRIEALLNLNHFFNVDLYGTNWNKISKDNLSWIYLKNYKKINKLYRGVCDSKFEILKNYKFSICFENSEVTGYVSEKIYDCFYVGTIPIYLGAPNISDLIPSNTYIDFKKFKDYKSIALELKNFDIDKIEEFKNNGRRFLADKKNEKFYYSFINIIKKTINIY